MPHTFTINQSVRIAGKTLSVQRGVTNSALTAIDEAVPIGTNVEYDIDFKAAQLKGLVIYSAVAATIKTNSSTVPDDEFTLEAGELIVWDVDGISDNPITVDVASVFITNAAAGLIQIYALHDPTA